MARIVAGRYQTIVEVILTVDEEKADKVVDEYGNRPFDEYDAETREKILKDSEAQYSVVATTEDGESIEVDITDYMISISCDKSYEITPDFVNDLISKVQN